MTGIATVVAIGRCAATCLKGWALVQMRSKSSRKPTARISRTAAFLAAFGCGGVLYALAHTFAVSSPFAGLKEHDRILDASSDEASVHEAHIAAATTVLAMTTPVLPTSADESDSESEATYVLASVAAEALPAPASVAFKTRWSNDVPYWREPSPIVVTPQLTRLAPPERTASLPPPKRESLMHIVDQYLWEVYQRSPIKSDSSGDFTWKDPAAAKHRGMSMPEYVIGGMDPDFREQLYHAGRAMDAAGIKWSMLSAFRDDYRQELASGLKAHGGNSLHGGSVATGGYGHGRAVDVTNAEGEVSVVWHWIDVHGAAYGLTRPMPGYDPSHIQSRGDWHEIAQHLRQARAKLAETAGGGAAEPPTGSTRVSARTNRND